MTRQDEIAPVLERASGALSRLDERVRTSAVREGWIERMNYLDAQAAAWTAGELVQVEDLVLHDAFMDQQAPTPALIQAARVLRARRLIAQHEPGWSWTREGLAHLLGRHSDANPDRRGREHADPRGLVYGLDHDEEASLGFWRSLHLEVRGLPALGAAAVLLDAWRDLDPVERGGWLGPLLVADYLRQRQITPSHLVPLNHALRLAGYRTMMPGEPTDKTLEFITAVAVGAVDGERLHNRLSLARQLLARKLQKLRRTSRLGEAVDLSLSRPVVTVALLANELKLSKQGAQLIMQEIAPAMRELIGQKSYRAWAIL